VTERFGPYELSELLGRGGMGEVWRAVDTRKARTVALKRLPAELTGEREFEDRFRREAHAAARLNDPHVIPIHDFGEIEGRLFLDMRLVHGQDLGAAIESVGALEAARSVSVIEQVASALDAAHDEGLVHRDVKPSNVLLTPSKRTVGPQDFVYLIDFGIATGAAFGTRLTQTGMAIGTAAYMAPERFTDGVDADPRIDVYALGCVLHEALTGKPPFAGRDFPSLMYAHINTTPTAPSRITGGLPRGFDDVVARALAKDPDERYARAGELAEAARGALADGASSQRVLETQIPPRPPRPASPLPPRPVHRRPTMAPQPGFAQPWPPGAPRYGPAPGPPPAPVPVRAPRGRIVAAATALPVAAVVLFVCLAVMVYLFSECSIRTAACAGGIGALLAFLLGGGGAALAIAGLTARGRRTTRRAGLAWAALAAALVLFLVAAAVGA
jgi:serine/threonine protein kinase